MNTKLKVRIELKSVIYKRIEKYNKIQIKIRDTIKKDKIIKIQKIITNSKQNNI